MNIFENFEKLQEEIKERFLKSSKEDITTDVAKKYDEYLESLTDEIDFAEYSKRASAKLKELVAFHYHNRKKEQVNIQKLQEQLISLARRIIYLSYVTIYDYLEILRLFNYNCEVIKTKQIDYLLIDSIEFTIPKSKMIPLYRYQEGRFIKTPYLFFEPRIEDFIKYYITLKSQERYISIEDAYQEFQEKDCIKR